MSLIRRVARQNQTTLMKTGSYYLIHICVAALVAYAVTGNLWASLTLPALEARFKGRGPWKKGLPTLLQTLEALGRAQAVAVDGDMAWRG